MPTIGDLGPATHAVESQRGAALLQRLPELRWIENRTIAIEYRWAEGREERFTEIAAEFDRLKVDVIFTYERHQSSLQSGRHRSSRSYSRWRESRHPGRTADQIRPHHQPNDREGARPRPSAVGTHARRPADCI